MTDIRALIADDAFAASFQSLGQYRTALLAALAQPEPQGFTPDHVNLMCFAFEREPWATWLRRGGCLESAHCELSDLMLAVLARWGRPVIEPVPVSEGMPGPEDVNDDGEVWVEEPAYDYPLGDTGDYDSEPGRWVLKPLSSLDKRFKRRWLPHSALPVPGVEGADG
jgi:hypothetical protein